MLWCHEGGNSGPTRGARAPWGGGRYKNSPDLAEPPRATTLCSDSQLIWPPYFKAWSTLTFSGILPQRTNSQDGDRSTWLPSPTVANSNVSKTKSLKSCILYAAPLTSNVRCPPPLSGGEKFNIVWSCSTQSCSYSNIMLFVPSERIRVITQGEVGWIKIATCAELCGSELFGQLHIAVCAFWEN